MLSLRNFLFLFILAIGMISCGDDEDITTEDPKTIAELASETSSLSTLVAALERADLVETLNGTGSFTVFAPTNDAFNALLQANGFSGLEDIPVDALTSILRNHVVTGQVLSTQLSTGYVKTNATESTTGNAIDMYINVDNGVTINGTASVTQADITTSNGVVHIVDAVIDIPTVVTFATSDATFATLVQALTRSDLTTDFVSVLSGAGPFTVFAPTNDAFGDLLAELNLSGLGDIDVNTLDAVLKYHVVSGANVLSTDLVDDMPVGTLLASEFMIDLDNGAEIVDANGRRIGMVVTDVQAGNGVVHVVNKVILP